MQNIKWANKISKQIYVVGAKRSKFVHAWFEFYWLDEQNHTKNKTLYLFRTVVPDYNPYMSANNFDSYQQKG